MSTFEKRVDLAVAQPHAAHEASLRSAEPLPSVEGRTFTNRYEVKYLIGPRQLDEVKAALQGLLRSDGNNSQDNTSQDGGYYVHSIYFDSPDLCFLREKFEGQLTRVKPRIRSYRPSIDGAPKGSFLELKGRHDRVVEKRRCPIDHSLAKLLLTQCPVHPNGWSARHTVLGEFQYMSHRLNLVPTISVLYHRTAYFGAFWPNLRVTFDRLVLGSFATGLETPSEDFKQIIPGSQTVLELKYNDKAPAALMQRIHALGLKQRTFSKYAAAVERCYRGLNGNHSLH